MAAAVSFIGELPARGPAVVALAGTMLDPVLTFSRMRPEASLPLVPAEWLGMAESDGLRSAATALGAAIGAVRTEPVILLGHSSGGALALLLALERPELVSGLLLVNTGANTHGHGDPDAPRRLAAGLTPELVDAFLDRCFAAPLPSEVKEGLAAYALSCPVRCVVSAMTSQRAMDLQPLLPQIRCPTVIVHGAQDKVRTRAHIDVLLHGIPGSTVLSAPCGHTPPLEEPGLVESALVQLLRRVEQLQETKKASARDAEEKEDAMKRRQLMAAAAATPFGARATAAQPRLVLPAGSCDTHVHVLDPVRFPYVASRRYTPGPATTEALVRMQDGLGLSRVVLVQNSVYGTDHRCLLDALATLGPQRARGVGTIGTATTEAEIAELDRAGVRGTRLNLEVRKDRNADAAERTLREAADRIPKTWRVHINAALPVIADMAEVIARLPGPVVLDHFAHIEAEYGPRQVGVDAVLDLLRSGKAFVKLSGPYQVSRRAGYDDITPVARVLVEAAPQQVMWGSDWPHTGGAGRPADQPVEFIEPFRTEDDAANLALLAEWVPDAAARRQILVDTPAAVYGFTANPA